jgi:excinuclease ABC subunit A
MKKPFKDLTQKERAIIFYGSADEIVFDFQGKSSQIRHHKKDYYEGVINNLERRHLETTSRFMREWIESLMSETTCSKCHGKKLNTTALSVKFDQLDIIEMTDLSVKELVKRFDQLTLSKMDAQIAEMILKELNERLGFLNNVGLDYLTLSRRAATLSGGESQRIRLATQIGSQLTGVLYVLDEPSIGLHQRDNARLIETLKKMRDLGNTLIVVEHDEETMEAADYIVDVGPGAGDEGGEIIFAGTYAEILKADHSITGRYLAHKESIHVPKNRRPIDQGMVSLKDCHENNLKHIDVDFPLSVMTVVTGVSGSGKSSLVHGCLYQGLYNRVYKPTYYQLKVGTIEGSKQIGKIILIDQSPIGRTPRSNPGTYTGVFDDIRDLFALTQEAKLRGYEKGRFSFNVKGGRCESCHGDGVIKIEMNFLPDVYVPCEVCQGKRYNQETLQVLFKGKSIADVLEMSVTEGIEFFKNIPKVEHKLKTLEAVGLGYLKIGQQAPTLSGGEAQRVKLSKELLKKLTSDTMYILDEPTTGLHSADVKKLLAVLQSMVDQKATVVVIEHNLDVIKQADHLIDLGPEGGDLGGTIVFTGTPENIIKEKKSYTGTYLKKLM